MADQAFQGEVVLANPGPGPVDAPVERQQQADGELGDGVGRIGGHADDGQAEALGRFEIDVVEAGGAERDQAGAAGGKRLQDVGVEGVVDEDADGGEALGEAHRGVVEARLEEEEFVAGRRRSVAEKDAVVGLGAEDGNAHVWAPLGLRSACALVATEVGHRRRMAGCRGPRSARGVAPWRPQGNQGLPGG